MGYIMPVDRYSYINYQERVVEDRSRVTPVNSIFHTMLDRTREEITNEYDRQLPSTYQMPQLNTKNLHVADRTYAEITGTGRHVNEII
jgi:hypothetical protein